MLDLAAITPSYASTSSFVGTERKITLTAVPSAGADCSCSAGEHLLCALVAFE
jgi:hypothetical protein